MAALRLIIMHFSDLFQHYNASASQSEIVQVKPRDCYLFSYNG